MDYALLYGYRLLRVASRTEVVFFFPAQNAPMLRATAAMLGAESSTFTSISYDKALLKAAAGRWLEGNVAVR